MVEQLMVALLAQGHCLLEGVPGVAKTLAVRSFATVVVLARAAGTLTSYDRDRSMGRTAVLTDGTVLTYESQYQSLVRAS